MACSPKKPFLKWAGKKEWAISLLQELYAPYKDLRYRDLTLGSGAIPLALTPHRVKCSDVNPFLIQLWQWVQSDGKLTIDLKSDAEYFKECAERFNTGCDPQQAQLFYLLNRTCHGGLYRSSKIKFFNVTWGKYPKFYGQIDLSHYKELIHHWGFSTEHWQDAVIEDDDFVVFDPPYHSEDNKGFVDYFGKFDEQDQINAAQKLAALSSPVIAFNAATKFIKELYGDLGFDIQLKEAPRSISRNGDRTPALEVVATKNIQINKTALIKPTQLSLFEL